MVIIPGIFTLWAIIYLGIFYLTNINSSITFESNWWDFYFVPLIFGLASYVMFFIASGIELIIILIRVIARKKVCVLNNFLLNNKFYNFTYCFLFCVHVLVVLEFLLVTGLILMLNYTS